MGLRVTRSPDTPAARYRRKEAPAFQASGLPPSLEMKMAEKYSQEHWERVAEVYEASPASPAVAIAEKFGVARPTARAWILRLRRDGLIRETSHGRTAEQHDRITRIAADLKVERHELAQIILRHIPNGKLYIHERDATPTSAPTDFAATFGSVIRDARKERGWTQADLASSVSASLGHPVPTLAVCRTEAGTRPTPLAEVAAYATVLDLSVDELIKAQVGRGEF